MQGHLHTSSGIERFVWLICLFAVYIQQQTSPPLDYSPLSAMIRKFRGKVVGYSKKPATKNLVFKTLLG